MLGLDSFGLVWEWAGGSCEHGNEVCSSHTIQGIFPIMPLFYGVSWIDRGFEGMFDVWESR